MERRKTGLNSPYSAWHSAVYVCYAFMCGCVSAALGHNHVITTTPTAHRPRPVRFPHKPYHLAPNTISTCLKIRPPHLYDDSAQHIHSKHLVSTNRLQKTVREYYSPRPNTIRNMGKPDKLAHPKTCQHTPSYPTPRAAWNIPDHPQPAGSASAQSPAATGLCTRPQHSASAR